VLPFANRAVTVGPMTFEKLFSLLERSVKTCGAYSVLMSSGLKVLFEQDCAGRLKNGVDPDATIYKITTAEDELLYDRRAGVRPPADRVFEVATLDFLADGGSGYSGFIGVPLVKDHGILREAMTEE